jgi:hypothetical protein
VDTVVTFVDDFDPNGWITSNKFQPTIAGYYNIQVAVWWNVGSVTNNQHNIQLRQNGTTQVAIQVNQIITGGLGSGQEIDTILYFNGTTDYVEVTAYTGNPTSQDINGASSGTWITGALITLASGSSGTAGANGSSGTSGANGTSGSAGTSGISPTRTFGITIDGGGSAITTGIKGDVTIPFAMSISGWTITADQTGSIVVDLWKDTYANFPPTAADTITGSEKPTLSSAVKNQDNNLTTWTTSVSSGDIIRFNVDSVSTVTRVTLTIYGL